MPATTFLADGGAAGALMRAHDWLHSPLGEPATWPQPLKTLVEVMLAANQPMFLAWGPERTLLYNDAYAEILADKHPGALGRDVLEAWEEIRADLLPIVETAYAGRSVQMDDILLVMHRRGYPEKTHFAFSYTPVRDEAGQVAGFFCPCVEITEQVMTQRRQVAERERLGRMFDQAPSLMAMLNGPDHVFDLTNKAFLRLVGGRDVVGRPVREALPDIAGQGFYELLDEVYASGHRQTPRRVPIRLQNAPGLPVEERVLDFIYEPVRDGVGAVIGIFVEGQDVTESVQAEAELRASEERARRIIEGVKDHSVFVTDAAGVVRDWTPGAEAIFGWSADEIAGQSAEVIFTPEDREAGVPAQELATAREAGYAADERWHVRRDGSHFFANGSTRPLHGPDGEITGYIKIARDETKRRAVEAALRTSEARFQALVNSIDQMVWSTRPDGHHDYYNQRWYDFTGVPEGSTNGKAWNGVFHPEDQERAWAAWRHSLATGEPYHIEYRLRHHSGQYRWVLGRAQPMRDEAGHISRWYGTCTDIQDIVQAREVLARSREELAREVAERTAERDQVWHSSHDLMLVAGFDATILAVNPAWTAVLGWNDAELLGRSFVDLIHPDDLAKSLAEVERLTAEGRTTMQFENRYRRKDGAWVWLSWAVSSHEGRFYGVARNVTQDKERQAELALAQEALRQSQKMEAMGQLTGGVAHDFNNLLTPIIGVLDRLVTRGVGSERERRSMAGALESAERAKILVQRLLAFARRQPLQPVAVDVAALVTGMADLIGSTLGPTIDVRVNLAADLPPAKADPNQLEMALLNLAVNARDAMSEGGTLTLAASRESVRGRHRSGVLQGDYVRLAVSDTGTGMDAATLARAVEPFFSTKGIGKGTGLGLSMAHGLAAQLGGALTIQSHPGRGTTIELWLPVSAEPVDRAEADQAPPGEAVTSRGCALLVDDEDLVRMSTADMLEDLGFRVVEAGSAEAALRLLHEGTAVDLLVTDHLMPGMSGAELAREVRTLIPGLPMLVVSGYAEVEGLAPDLPRLVKPFRAAELAERVAALMPDASAGK